MVQPALGKFAAAIGREALIHLVTSLLSPKPDDDDHEAAQGQKSGKTRGQHDTDDEATILRSIRQAEGERLAALREINYKEDELVTFFRQVRENEAELIELFKQVRETEIERVAQLREASGKWDDLIEMLREVSRRLEQIAFRKELFDEQLDAMHRDGFRIDSVGDEQAIVSKGRILGIGRQRMRVTMNNEGELMQEDG